MTPFNRAYITHTAFFMPGDPVHNDDMHKFIGPINRMSSRIKRNILAENGITKRHYAIDVEGKSLHSVTSMAATVVQTLIHNSSTPQFIAAATTGGDSAAPGLANLIQGHLQLPPLETLSVSGICAASIGALNAAAQAVECGSATQSVAVASEFPSRLFKASRFVGREKDVDFDAHFLRWMLSDGAGGVAMSNAPAKSGFSLKIKWIHQKSFAGDMPTCMQVGMSRDNHLQGYLDYPTLAEAEQAGAYDLRQNIRLLPNLFDLGLHEYAQLVKDGHLELSKIATFLCHYSSERFKPMIAELMQEAGIAIAADKWFSNLSSKGNTGAASIFIMLDEFFKAGLQQLKVGDQVFGFVPESGRFSVAYFLLEVVDEHDRPISAHIPPQQIVEPLSMPPVSAQNESGHTAVILQKLMVIWHEYRSQVFRTALVNSIMAETITLEDYRGWMECWIPQVREGSLWMRRAASSMTPRYQALAQLVQTHAGEEQLDWQVLYNDYLAAGGMLAATNLTRNPGGEALNAFMHAYASQPDPIGLLGGIYIIEGTGQRIVPTLLPKLKQGLGISSSLLKFIEYHGENDQAHMMRWLSAVKMVIAIDPRSADQIVQVAESVAALYLQQWKFVITSNQSPFP